MAGVLKVDTISEITAAAGVTVDGVLLKDGGIVCADGASIEADIINEATAAAGVTADGVLLKDGGVTLASGQGVASSVSNVIAPFIAAVAPQALSGAGAVTLTEYKTNWTTTGADAGTLADGTVVGMIKKIKMVVDGGDGTLTPSNLSGGTTITFSEVGDEATLMWDGTNWVMIDSSNLLGTGATPVLA